MLDRNVDLLERFREGDINAFNEVYYKYAPKLAVRLIKLVKLKHIVEEILQDVFLKVWLNREKIDPDRGFVSFLNHISDNLAMDFFRKVQRDKKLQLEIWSSTIDLSYITDDSVLGKEYYSIIQDAINSLSPKRKEIFILNKIENKNYKEIAEQLHISTSTVSNQLVMSLKEIRKYLVRFYGKDLVVSLMLFLSLEFYFFFYLH